jgi:hypothetical protein
MTNLADWENHPVIAGFSGTACKCGAHVSVIWERGGREWLEGHIAEVHAEAFDWKAAIKHSLSLSPKEGAKYLASLLGEEEKETLSNA